jgi:hypothetical protein
MDPQPQSYILPEPTAAARVTAEPPSGPHPRRPIGIRRLSCGGSREESAEVKVLRIKHIQAGNAIRPSPILRSRGNRHAHGRIY